MLMLAAEARSEVTAPGSLIVPHPAPPSAVDPDQLGAAIQYHRNESHRHAKAAKQHRTELRKLLRRRDQHIAQLRASGWQLAPIASLYKVTKERIAQITKTPAGGETFAVSCQGGDAT
jgi:hypothetical protein